MWRPWCDDSAAEIEEDNDFKNKRVHLPRKAKELVLNVYNTLQEDGDKYPLKKTAHLTKVPITTVQKIIKNGVYVRKTRKDTGQRRTLFDFDLDVIRRTVYSMYEENILPTLKTVHQRLNDNNTGVNCSISTLRNALKSMGFTYKKVDKRRVLMESYRLRQWRHKYLLTIKKFREEQRPITYLDETWYDTYETESKGWTNGSEQCTVSVPASRGKRLIILNAGSENGWVDNCSFLSAKNIRHCNVDYHDNMNAEVFEKWFTEKLLPNLPANNVIVMDNASYHSRQINKVPTQNNTKAEIIEYLYKNDIYFEESYNKAQLLEVVKSKPVDKIYYCDTAAENLGHSVLRLPPYYCIFNPIELIWSQLKNGIRKHNTAPTVSHKVIETINSEINKITAENWKNCVRHVIEIENQYQFVNNSTSELIITVNTGEIGRAHV